MSTETEAKIRVSDHDAVRQQLRKLGGELQGTHLEINIFMDTEDRSLMAADKGLRVRIDHDLQKEIKSCTLTFKGPRQPGTFKSREETETTLGDAEVMVAVFKELGYKPILSFEKRRESWVLNNYKVELDELPFLGLFVEVEGPDERSIAAITSQLGLSSLGDIKTSYAGLLSNYLAENGINRREVKFNDLPHAKTTAKA